MKKMRKLSALLAAVVTASCMGAMNAFAAGEVSTNNYTEGGGGQSTYSDLKLEPYVTSSSNALTGSSNNDTVNHVWSIDIDGTSLVWEVEKVSTTTYRLKWNPSTNKYEKDSSSTNASYQMHNGDSVAKTATITNHSNFAVNYECSLVGKNADDSGNYYSLFDLGNDYSDLIDIGRYAEQEVTFDVNQMTNDIWDALFDSAALANNTAVTAAKLKYEFTADNIVPNDGNYAAN